jgi:hypothetical protein
LDSHLSRGVARPAGRAPRGLVGRAIPRSVTQVNGQGHR